MTGYYKAKIMVMMMAGLMAGILCGCTGSDAVANETAPTVEQTGEESVEKTEDESDETESDVEEAETVESEDVSDAVCTVYLSGAEDASAGMERTVDQFNDDGSYRIEHVSDDGMLSICEVGKLRSGNEGASPEEDAIEMARWILSEGDTISDEKAELNEEYSSNTTYPVYIVSFTTGSNEDSWSWKAFTLATDTCGLVYAIGAPADSDEDMLALVDRAFPKLRVVDKDEGLETNDGEYKMDLSAYYGMNIDDVAVDLPDLQYDDSYKTSSEGTTEVSGPTDMMEKMSDGYALAGPFFTIDKEGTVVGVSYGGSTYCICEISAGMSMDEAAKMAKSHDFTFSRVEIAHGTAKYVAIYDNGSEQLCITSDADGDFGKTEESDVTGNVDCVVINKLN